MKEKIKQILNFIKFDHDLLEQRLFWVIVFIGTIVTFVSAIITVIEKLGSFSCLTSISCLAFMITIMIFAYKKNAYHKCYIAMCYFLNCIFLPLNFYTCGGIDSGMILYYLVSIFLCVPCLKGKSRIITFVISLIMLEGTMIVSMIFPDAANSITRQQSYNDMIITFIITSCCLFAFSSAIINSYEKERNKRVNWLGCQDKVFENYREPDISIFLDFEPEASFWVRIFSHRRLRRLAIDGAAEKCYAETTDGENKCIFLSFSPSAVLYSIFMPVCQWWRIELKSASNTAVQGNSFLPGL